MGASVGNNQGPMAEINVTPLIDVVLVLLVVFMVITPMLQSGMAVDLPMATQTTTVPDMGQNIVVSVTEDQGWWVDDVEVTPETLYTEIALSLQKNPGQMVDGVLQSRQILVKADRDLPYEKVREPLDLLAEKGMTTVLIAAGKEK
jgi:biopolymer transport protein TolR